ncbi:MAG: hypothetical protein MI861_17305, partial [Pirellulales bacterium]|nr:hypothetical protein [Pirellulales bacterium]
SIRCLVVVWLGVVALMIPSAFGQEKEKVADMRERFADIAQRYQILEGTQPDGRPLALIKQPVLNWNNPERQTQAGALFFWTRGGRPAVALCIYPSGESHFDFEFQSLADFPISGNSGGPTLWEPNKHGITWNALPAAASPGAGAAMRLRQMRSLARQFTAALRPPDKPPRPLRMLAAPVYRYKASGVSDTLIDGAVFSFVLGTDPEALLMLEAIKNDKGEAGWRYSLARMTMVPSAIRHNGEIVWQTEWASSNRYSPYFVVHNQEQDDAEITVFE